jgi:hypothetical protein
MIPMLKSIDILFGGEVLGRLCPIEAGVERCLIYYSSVLGLIELMRYRLHLALELAGKGADRLKNVDRIIAAMKV